MLILDPNEIKDMKKESADQGQRLVASLSMEEARLNKDVAILRENFKAEKQRIEDELEENKATLSIRRTVLAQEVESLESRKKDALKPVLERLNQANALYESNQKEIIELVARGVKIKETEEKLIEGFEIIKDREDDLKIEESRLQRREKGTIAGENEIKRSSVELATNWVEYHKSVNDFNTRIKETEMRELKITDREKVLDIRTAKQDEREIEQNNHDRVIKDKYETLERTIAEVKNKNIINI